MNFFFNAMTAEGRPEGNDLNVLLTSLTFYNDNKTTHTVLLATVVFGQVALLGIFPKEIIDFKDASITSGLFFLIYFSLCVIGRHETFRFINYSSLAHSILQRLRVDYPDVMSIPRASPKARLDRIERGLSDLIYRSKQYIFLVYFFVMFLLYIIKIA